ncbi:unnamed protein product [Mucor hiemalis]
MENEMLKKKLASLKAEHNKRDCSMTSEDTHSSNPASMTTGTEEEDDSSDDFDEFNIPSNAANVYTQGVNTNYDIGESLAMFTGLRYNEGERSVGISLGLEGGELTRVDMDHLMSQPVIVNSNTDNLTQRNRTPDQPRSGKKKQRMNPSSEEAKICSDCGTTEAPEWRRGPNGPKTLCNACGLRWSKSKKKMEQSNQ